jgi:hypothetical protein
MLAVSIEADNSMLIGALAVGLIIVLGGLIYAVTLIKGWIREVAGVKETQTTEIAGQPIRFTQDPQTLTKAEHDSHCHHMERRVVALESRTARIERKMESDKSEIIEAGELRMRKIHERVDTVLHAVARVEGAIEQMRADHR